MIFIGGCPDDKVSDMNSYASEKLNPNENSPTKVLGIPWNTKSDELIFSMEILKKYPPGRISKRMLLSAVASVFDPLRILAPTACHIEDSISENL